MRIKLRNNMIVYCDNARWVMNTAAKNDSDFGIPNFNQNTIRYTIYFSDGIEARTVRSLTTARKMAKYFKGYYKKWDVNNI